MRRCFNVTDVLTVIILKCLASAGDSIDYVTAIRGLQLIGFFCQYVNFEFFHVSCEGVSSFKVVAVELSRVLKTILEKW